MKRKVAEVEPLYLPVPGAHISLSEADAYGRRMAQLEKRDGNLTPAAVLTDASDPKSPLHDAFEWDDSRAAFLQRIERAADIIRSVRVVVREAQDDRVQARAFALVQPGSRSEPGSGVYMAIDKVLADDALSSAMLKRMRHDLSSMRRRYEETFRLTSQLRPLSDALGQGIEAVDELLADGTSE